MTADNPLRKASLSPLTNAIETGRPPSPLRAFNYRVFIVPAVLMIVGALVWVLALVFWPQNYAVILWGEIILAVGLFVAIILGFWVMTLVRMPRW